MSIKISTGAWEALLSTSSFKGVFDNGVLCIYSGAQPADADAAENGTLLAEVNVDGATFTPGGGSGLTFAAASGKSISKTGSETWKADFAAAGAMAWFRFYDNDKVTGASTSAKRFDGRVGTSRADLEVVTTAATVGGSITLSDITFNFRNV